VTLVVYPLLLDLFRSYYPMSPEITEAPKLHCIVSALLVVFSIFSALGMSILCALFGAKFFDYNKIPLEWIFPGRSSK